MTYVSGAHLVRRVGGTFQDASAAGGAAERGGARLQRRHGGTEPGLRQLGSAARSREGSRGRRLEVIFIGAGLGIFWEVNLMNPRFLSNNSEIGFHSMVKLEEF